MANDSTVKVDFLNGWSGETLFKLSSGLDKMANDIKRRSETNAPVDTGALRSSHHVNRIDNWTREIVAGDSDVPYARRRHYENNKNPQTKKYLENAANDVFRNDRSEYFGGLIK